MSKTKIYLTSFFKYYLPKKKKLIFVIVLSLGVYFWINMIINNIRIEREFAHYGLIGELAQTHEGIFVLFIKPIFVYIVGLIIIKKI